MQIDNCMYRYITMDSFVCTGILCAIEVQIKKCISVYIVYAIIIVKCS